jgi:thiamine biosynthesis lipoprotein ApbE
VPTISVVVNFGDDIQVTRAQRYKQPWRIGIESLEEDDKNTTHILKSLVVDLQSAVMLDVTY